MAAVSLAIQRRTANQPVDALDQSSDAQLLQAAKADRRAFTPLYHRFVGPIYQYCYRRLDSREAEDATSQIFLQALASLHTCKTDNFRGWLFAIAHNVVVDRFRARHPDLSFDEALGLSSIEPSPEDAAVQSDSRRDLELAIKALPVDQRTVIELRLAGLTGAEMAQALGRSPEATRMLQFRAFTRLRALLTDPAPTPTGT
jgi:RNA polymerase sigma factor (sigma-70 family)